MKTWKKNRSNEVLMSKDGKFFISYIYLKTERKT